MIFHALINKFHHLEVKMILLYPHYIFECLICACVGIPKDFSASESQYLGISSSHESISGFVSLSLLLCFFMKIVPVYFDDYNKWRC